MTSAAALLKSAKGTPNVALWGRDASDRVTGKTTGDKYNSLYGANSKFIVLDCELTNNGATVATVSLDGVRYGLSAGQIKSLSNHPWSEFEVISAAAAAIDIAMDGILYDSARDLGFLNEKEGFNVWR